MKVLIDECLPVALKKTLSDLGHESQAARYAGLGSKKNGELLAIADGVWDVLLTSDRNIRYQQNLEGRRISVVILRSKSNRLSDLLSLMPRCAETLQTIQPGQVVEIEATDGGTSKTKRT